MLVAIQALHKTKLDDKDPDHPLTRVLRARQEIELLKVPVMEDLTRDALAQGHHVILFVNFLDSARALRHRLRDASPMIIQGEGQTMEERTNIVQEFQRDRLEVLIGITQCSGLGIDLHDIRGEFPRRVFHSPGLSAFDFIQAAGRTERDGALSSSIQTVLYAAGTYEVRAWERMVSKTNNISALVDGDISGLSL
jgi:ERCC4-related helicase